MTSSTTIRPGQTLENPVTGERFTFTHTAASTGGELLAFDFALRPGGAVPIPHVHPIQTERFEVVAGRMRFRVGLRTRIAGPGDVVEVAPGVLHSFANAGDEEARLRVEVRPALAMERMLAEVVALARAGRMTRRGLPRNPLELAALARRYDREAHAPLLSVGVQRALLAPLVLAGALA
jgi:quercetin dioxygenase-like cupin family protein